jgi:hypothetical protein
MDSRGDEIGVTTALSGPAVVRVLIRTVTEFKPTVPDRASKLSKNTSPAFGSAGRL